MNVSRQADEREYGTALSNIRFSGGAIRVSFRQQGGLVDGADFVRCQIGFARLMQCQPK